MYLLIYFYFLQLEMTFSILYQFQACNIAAKQSHNL